MNKILPRAMHYFLLPWLNRSKPPRRLYDSLQSPTTFSDLGPNIQTQDTGVLAHGQCQTDVQCLDELAPSAVISPEWQWKERLRSPWCKRSIIQSKLSM